ncbi:Uncharacterised protein [Mycobacteroides abscessus subsp. bolletii]|nr:Uncharacterised protein [Mycobacteroides abscessus subsp. bolletii]
MNVSPCSAIFDFEIYVLMTMELRLKMTNEPSERARLGNKLAEHGLTLQDGKRIHGQMTEALADEESFFANLKTFLGVNSNAAEVQFTSVLWPEFDFTASVGPDGQLSARYHHARGSEARIQPHSVRDIPNWSMDLKEFGELFGPLSCGLRHPIFHELIPAYEEHQFEWDGRDYSAGFCWGLFMFAAQHWD